MKNRMSFKKKQSGVVLAVSLIMLLLLTMIGLSGTQVTSLEEKMAGNSRDQNIAFQAAESTLIAAENLIMGLTQAEIDNTLPLPNPANPFDGTGGLLGTNDSEPDYFDSNNTWDPSANPLLSHNTPNGFSGNLGLTANPRYIIKLISQTGSTPIINIFRITARARGRAEGTEVILQVIYQRTI